MYTIYVHDMCGIADTSVVNLDVSCIYNSSPTPPFGMSYVENTLLIRYSIPPLEFSPVTLAIANEEN